MVTSGAITNRVDRLEVRGLVTRETDRSNRRFVAITLTETRWDVIDEILETAGEQKADLIEARVLASLSADEQQQLATLLRTLLIGRGDEPPLPPVGATGGADGGSKRVAEAG